MTYPFDIEEARKIKNGESDSKLITNYGDYAEIVQIDDDGDFPVMCLVIKANGSQKVVRYTRKGKVRPITRSVDDLFIFNENRIDNGTVPYSAELAKNIELRIIDYDRNPVRILMRNVFRIDLVNGFSTDNMLCLADTEDGAKPFVCDYDGMRDGNQILFLKRIDET